MERCEDSYSEILAYAPRLSRHLINIHIIGLNIVFEKVYWDNKDTETCVQNVTTLINIPEEPFLAETSTKDVPPAT